MPLWLIYHTSDTFGDNASRQALAKDITTIYTGIGLPAFYVVVNFITTPEGKMWIGGEAVVRPFVRISVDHIAVKLENKVEEYQKVTAAIEEVIKPHIAEKDYDWEIHIDETERELWRVKGLIPPQFGSEEEKLWARVNKAVPYDNVTKSEI
ncbi:hypothetical protein HJFPF1_07156 [Paramyrothecium foliicola]|nr:hypothetical protein HJFPF1_07156 [Paramyrothecium foliicola]